MMTIFNGLVEKHDLDIDLSLFDASQSSSDLSLPIDLFQGSCDGVQIIHHNVQGLNSKLMEISQWLHAGYQLPIILCCSETWLTDNDPVPKFNVFDSFCSPMLQRPVNPKKCFPGSCMFVSKSLCPENSPVCEEVEQLPSSVNVCCCFVTVKHHRIAVLSVYRYLPCGVLSLDFT